MTTIGENALMSLLKNDTSIHLIEPNLYSILSHAELNNSYDSRFGNIYDWVACNPLYNRFIWGYSITRFASLIDAALRSSRHGNVLDLGCGSLAFTAKSYIQYSGRPVVLVDQSLKMLRIAKSRLINQKGEVPDNMVFLHADAHQLCFQPDSFNTIISLNLLHCLNDTTNFLGSLKNILTEDGKMYFTTLVKANRPADCYLKALADGGKLVSRNMEQHQEAFNNQGMPIKYVLNGNMAFIYYGTNNKTE